MAMLGAAPPSHAQQIIEPEVEKGQRKLEAFSAFVSGFNGGAAGDTREVLSLSLPVWPHRFLVVQGRCWAVRASGPRRSPGDRNRFRERVRNPECQEGRRPGFWLVHRHFRRDQRRTRPTPLTFGPVIRLGAGATSLILNPFLEQTFGRNRDEGIAFLLRLAAQAPGSAGFAVGVEGFGRFQDIAGRGGAEEHGIGPLLAFELPLAEKRSLSLEAGWLRRPQ